MNKVILSYILKNFLKLFIIVLLIVYSFGIILNLFEEIEFFKNINVSIFKPLLLTSIFVPSMIINLLPFIIFVSSMWFMVKIRNNKDLLTLKVYGYSNIKIFFILASTSFLLGWFILIFVSPISSSMLKYYEKTKSQYARDIDHLVTFNKNGLWIKENFQNNKRIITAKKLDKSILTDVTIFEFDNKYSLDKKLFAKNANINTNNWTLNEVTIFYISEGFLKKRELDNFQINSIYNQEKINNLFNNADTISFTDLLTNYEKLLTSGYEKHFLNQSLQTMLVLPFFLFLMTAIASILTMHTLKKSENFKFVLLGLIICVLVYYFKDLSLALGKIDRIPINLGIWSPVIALSFFTFIGVLQINEK